MVILCILNYNKQINFNFKLQLEFLLNCRRCNFHPKRINNINLNSLIKFTNPIIFNLTKILKYTQK